MIFAILFLSHLLVQTVGASLEIRDARPRPQACRGNETGFASEEEIYKKYFVPLTSISRPRYNSSESVKVSLKFSLSKISDVNERSSVLKITGFLGVVCPFLLQKF